MMTVFKYKETAARLTVQLSPADIIFIAIAGEIHDGNSNYKS